MVLLLNGCRGRVWLLLGSRCFWWVGDGEIRDKLSCRSSNSFFYRNMNALVIPMNQGLAVHMSNIRISFLETESTSPVRISFSK
jgi:hypothetical protein